MQLKGRSKTDELDTPAENAENLRDVTENDKKYCQHSSESSIAETKTNSLAAVLERSINKAVSFSLDGERPRKANLQLNHGTTLREPEIR